MGPASNRQISKPKITLNREREVVPLVFASFLFKLDGLQITRARIKIKLTVFGILVNQARINSPIFIGLPSDVNPPALHGPIIDVLFNAVRVITINAARCSITGATFF